MQPPSWELNMTCIERHLKDTLTTPVETEVWRFANVVFLKHVTIHPAIEAAQLSTTLLRKHCKASCRSVVYPRGFAEVACDSPSSVFQSPIQLQTLSQAVFVLQVNGRPTYQAFL